MYSGCPGRAHYARCAFAEPPSPLGNRERAAMLDLREVITERKAKIEKKNRERGGYEVLETEAMKFADSCPRWRSLSAILCIFAAFVYSCSGERMHRRKERD